MVHTKNITIKSRDYVLDFWRGISIILVLLHHLIYYRYADFFRGFCISTLSDSHSNVNQVLLFLNKLLLAISERSGPLGVKIFFVISGYIITKLLLDEEKINGSIKAINFYFRRVTRILPPLYFYLGSLLIFRAMGWIQFFNSQILHSASFLCNAKVAECGWYFIHTWSLAIEEQFYLIWPLFFLPLLINPRLRIRILALILCLLLTLSALGIFIVAGWLDIALSFACIGIGALYAMSEKFKIIIEKYGLIIIGAIFFISIFFYYFVPFLHEFVHQTYRLIQPFVILIVIVSTYKFGRFIKTKFFTAISRIGLISYSLYLWQQVFVNNPTNYPVNSFLKLPFLMLFFALFSYFIIEKPIMNWARLTLKKSSENISNTQ